jgi:hypothetical protein
MTARRRRWSGMLLVICLLGAAGCASVRGTPSNGEIAAIRLHNAQTGVNERCGIDMIREVVRANDLTWSERLFFTWKARADARRAVEDEERWRQQCVDRFKQRGFEVATTPSAR